MTERRLFAPELPPEGGRIVLDAESRRHARVLRLAPGAALTLFDGRGSVAQGALLEGGDCRVEPPSRAAMLTPALTLVLGLPKGKTLDVCVRAATELGVSSIELAICARSQRVAEPKLERLARVVREAARQSELLHLPRLRPPAPLAEVAARAPEQGLRLGCFAREGASAEADPALTTATEVFVAVGPEGGFTPEEIAGLRAAGYRSHPLGPSILRVETAVPVALALARLAAGS